MNFELPIAESKLRNTERLVHQGMWVLFAMAAALMVIVRRSAPARAGSLWVLGCALLAFMLWFSLRDAVRKLGRRNTEDQIVHEVKVFFQREPELAVAPARQPKLSPIEEPASDVPVNSAGFVTLKERASYRTLMGEPVVFDAMTTHEPVAPKTNFHAVLMPVLQPCEL